MRNLCKSTDSDQFFIWSMYCFLVLVYLMIFIGGLTRLTGSGLSIVEWKPILGALPPFTQQQWLAEFASYKQFPEYLQVNKGMSLQEFQSIYWLEYIHRLLARLLGIVLLVPLCISWVCDKFKRYRAHVIILSIVCFCQGIMGWYMVKSGLVKDPFVSPYRLGMHLLLALGILGIALRIVFLYSRNDAHTIQCPNWFKYQVGGGVFLLLLTITYGAFVAGLHAGKVYNTFPKMGPNWIPDELFYQRPWWKNLFEEPVTVQFIHRYSALSTVVMLWLSGSWGRSFSRSVHLRSMWSVLQVAIVFQVALGVLTIIYGVPIWLACAHQMWAVIVFGILIWLGMYVQKSKDIL